MLNYVDLFSGIGGFALGAYWAGMRFDRHYFSEINPFCVQLYQQRFPDAKPLGDIKNYKEWKKFEGHTICTAGFPCQPFSRAGRRRQRDDTNFLWPELSDFIQYHLPDIILIENVTDIDSADPVSVLEEIYDFLESLDYETFPALEIPAAGFNAMHYRNRVWILAYSQKNGWGQGGRLRQTQALENEPAGLEPEVFREKLSSGFYGRGYDGVSNRLDRLKGLGNAIVPHIAALFFSVIKELRC